MPSGVIAGDCDQRQSLTLSLFLGHPLLTLCILVGWEGEGTEVTWSRISLVPDAVLGYFPSMCFL